MRKHGIDDYWELVRRSQEDPEWFWPAAIEDMGLEFSQPWDDVVDLSRGPEWATWFVGGKLNIAWNCVHRWAERRPDAIAAVGLGEDGSRRELTFAELSARGDEARGGARPPRRRRGRPRGDLPADVAGGRDRLARVRAHRARSRCRSSPASRHPPSRSGSRPPRRRSRSRRAASTRRGREVPMLEILEEARREAPSVEHVVVAPWDELVADSPGELAAGRARLGDAVPAHLHVGNDRARRRASSTSRAASSSRSRARSATRPTRGPDDRIHFVTDMGWIMGPWTVVGGHAMGSTLVFAEGAPDWPHGPALEADRVGAGDGARHLPHADAGADPARRARDRSLVAAHDRHHGRAVEPGAVPLALRARSAAAAARSSTARAAPRSAPASSRRRRRDPDQGLLARRARARDGDGRRRRRGQLRCAARSASSSAASRSRA